MTTTVVGKPVFHMDTTAQTMTLLDLPAEIRSSILELVFDASLYGDGFSNYSRDGGIFVDDEYTAAANLQPLLVCKQFYQDASAIAVTRTPFIMTNLFGEVPNKLQSILHPKQIEAVRSIAFVADARHFRKLLSWRDRPFGMPSLRLNTLTIVLHRSAHWHYMFDFTADIVKLLRVLENVQKLVFVRNGALVKGSFFTWYNRLVGLIMKEDHRLRYDCSPAQPEKIWWKWSYDDKAQSFCLEALPSKPMMEEEVYMELLKPLVQDLMAGMENEEYNHDPRARIGF